MVNEIKLGDNIIGIRATALTLLYYKQEFKKDLLGDFMHLQELGEDISSLDGLMLLQFIWAMAKTEALAENLGKSFNSFQSWIEKLNRIDFGDNKITEIVEVISDAYFRGDEEQEE